MVVSKRFSKEEKDLDKQDTLEMLKQGITHAEIARQLGRSTQYIVNVKNKLVIEKLITEEEIKKAREEAIKSKKELKRIRSRELATEKEKSRNERKEKVLEKVKLGRTAIEISEELNIPINTINI